jgi:L-threonylcarbamoyladenylate synthase
MTACPPGKVPPSAVRRTLLRQLRRLAVIAIGFLILAIGIVLAALPVIPGGLPGILLGLTILSTELEWARTLRSRILTRGGRFLSSLLKAKGAGVAADGNGSLLEATPSAVSRAAAVLKRGRLVAFPTETVYGLGAVAFDTRAIARIFQAKGRPPDNPLIVHLSSLDMLESVAQEVPDAARGLMDAFWPGPLTLVLRRSSRLPSIVSAGLETVAVRVPAHSVALDLIRCAGQPIAAPSANRSGRPSPTTAEHVLRDLGDAVNLILDGGPTSVGVESTVVDLTGPVPVLLRPGGVPKEEIEQVTGPVLPYRPDGGPARSPGLKHRHYAPACRLVLVGPSEWQSGLLEAAQTGQRVGILCRSLAGPDGLPTAYFRRVPGGAAEYARALFSAFREAEEAGVAVLLVESVEEAGLGRAVMDRLRRAARPEGEIL